MLLHPDRYSTTGVPTKKVGIVVHDSESGDASYPTLLRLLQAPGDRENGHGGKYGAGYHALTDGAGNYKEVADSSAGPYSAPIVNKTWWHICIPGYARQTRDEWLDELSLNHIKGVAKFIVTKSRIDGIPLIKTTPEKMKTGLGGICSHHDVSLAWGATNHTDPGSNFPWDVLLNEVAKLSVPVTPVEEEMSFLIRPDNDAAVFIVSGIDAVWAVSQVHIDQLRASGMLSKVDPVVVPIPVLKTLVLNGPEPDYTGGDGGLPGRTKAAAFAAWIK